MLEPDVRGAIRAVVDDWRARHEASGDCTECMLELSQILLPLIRRSEISSDDAMNLTIAAGNYANGSDLQSFVDRLEILSKRL